MGDFWVPLAGYDADAIHDNVAAEIDALTEVTPVSGDWVLIEDASDSFNKKKADVGNIAGSVMDRVSIPMGGLAPLSASLPSNPQSVNARWTGWPFDDSTVEGVAGSLMLPSDWQTVSVWLAWTQTTGNSGNVFWRVAIDTGGDGDSTNTTGTIRDATVAAPTTNLVSQDQIGATVTVDAANDLLNFRILRNASDAGDTLTGDAVLIGAWLQKES